MADKNVNTFIYIYVYVYIYEYPLLMTDILAGGEFCVSVLTNSNFGGIFGYLQERNIQSSILAIMEFYKPMVTNSTRRTDNHLGHDNTISSVM